MIKAHTKLPPGGILVFLTGRQEIEYMCRKIKTLLDRGRRRKLASEQKTRATDRPQTTQPDAASASTPSTNASAKDGKAAGGKSGGEEKKNEEDSALALDSDEEEESEVQTEKSEGDTAALNPEAPSTDADGGAATKDGGEEEDGMDDQESAWALMSEQCDMKVRLLPLYSLLPTHQQMKVFKPAKEGATHFPSSRLFLSYCLG